MKDSAVVVKGFSDAVSVEVVTTTSPPTLSSVNFALGDTAGGGQSIILNGTSLDTVTTVTIGGTSASITAQTPTTCTVTLPAHASGAGLDIVATNAAGSTTLAAAFEYWTPAQITGIDTYLDANKGIIYGAGFKVGQWTGQDSNALAWTQANGANQPTQTANVFGSLPSLNFAGNQWLDLASGRAFATGLSWFFVGKTSTNFPAGGGVFDAPGNVIGRDDGSAWGGFGFDTGASAGLYYTMFDIGGVTSHSVVRGSALNNGTTRLYGITSDTTPNRKVYLGATQQGATDSPAGGYDTTNTTYKTIGVGFGDVEQWTGDLAAVITVVGVISGGDLTKLNKWAQQRWGTP